MIDFTVTGVLEACGKLLLELDKLRKLTTLSWDSLGSPDQVLAYDGTFNMVYTGCFQPIVENPVNGYLSIQLGLDVGTHQLMYLHSPNDFREVFELNGNISQGFLKHVEFLESELDT